MTPAQLEVLGRSGDAAFAELLGTLYALRFTGAITLHFNGGQPQMAELGRPLQVVFPEHPGNKALDRENGSAPSSSA